MKNSAGRGHIGLAGKILSQDSTARSLSSQRVQKIPLDHQDVGGGVEEGGGGRGAADPREDSWREVSSQGRKVQYGGGPHSDAAQRQQAIEAMNGGASAKLGHVAERFSTFYNDLEVEKQHRRETEAQRRATLAEAVAKLERSLDAEIKRRAEADKSIQMALEAELKSMGEKLMNQMRESQAQLKSSIDALSRTFAELHAGLRDEREERRTEVEALAATLASKTEDVQAGLDDERVARLEREAQTLKRVGEDLFRVQEKVDAERMSRETSFDAMQREMRESLSSRHDAESDFQQTVLNDIATLKNQIVTEREERITEDEQIVQAINDYTRALQDGLRIVNAT